MTLLEQLVDIRQRRNKDGQPGYRQVDVAEAMGVGQPSVSEFERGGVNPRLDTILRYAAAINVQVNFEVIDNGSNEEGS